MGSRLDGDPATYQVVSQGIKKSSKADDSPAIEIVLRIILSLELLQASVVLAEALLSTEVGSVSSIPRLIDEVFGRRIVLLEELRDGASLRLSLRSVLLLVVLEKNIDGVDLRYSKRSGGDRWNEENRWAHSRASVETHVGIALQSALQLRHGALQLSKIGVEVDHDSTRLEVAVGIILD